MNFKELKNQILKHPDAVQWNLKAIETSFNNKNINEEKKKELLSLINQLSMKNSMVNKLKELDKDLFKHEAELVKNLLIEYLAIIKQKSSFMQELYTPDNSFAGYDGLLVRIEDTDRWSSYSEKEKIQKMEMVLGPLKKLNKIIDMESGLFLKYLREINNLGLLAQDNPIKPIKESLILLKSNIRQQKAIVEGMLKFGYNLNLSVVQEFIKPIKLFIDLWQQEQRTYLHQNIFENGNDSSKQHKWILDSIKSIFKSRKLNKFKRANHTILEEQKNKILSKIPKAGTRVFFHLTSHPEFTSLWMERFGWTDYWDRVSYLEWGAPLENNEMLESSLSVADGSFENMNLLRIKMLRRFNEEKDLISSILKHIAFFSVIPKEKDPEAHIYSLTQFVYKDIEIEKNTFLMTLSQYAYLSNKGFLRPPYQQIDTEGKKILSYVLTRNLVWHNDKYSPDIGVIFDYAQIDILETERETPLPQVGSQYPGKKTIIAIICFNNVALNSILEQIYKLCSDLGEAIPLFDKKWRLLWPK